ncbi:hypothetical protein H1P_4960001 [Hyella patelloides LEGE 07179]|uniref:Uncharacterized protein n=1 Tax=Hyella patelloides LEGE 07179 TaxID=945734 RepID=A0A563VZA4_9CYAN|nr:hypothetical protein H1P_4960001 [Hyella patelloides LEGE 07179]
MVRDAGKTSACPIAMLMQSMCFYNDNVILPGEMSIISHYDEFINFKTRKMFFANNL